MTAEQMQLISMLAYILAGVLFVVSVVIFFVLDIPSVCGDLSGRTARRAIETLRKTNEATGRKSGHLRRHTEHGKLTDKISHSGSIRPQNHGLPIKFKTEKFPTNEMIGKQIPVAPKPAVYPSASATEVVSEELLPATEIISEELLPSTTLLAAPTMAQTGALLPEDTAESMADVNIFELELELVFYGANEIIS